ncbi:MAG: glycoside hydrolase family 13 protein [Clostridia bacterium]|nr:glycoside hydrolase family 13 protein [Clostridia bacterium]
MDSLKFVYYNSRSDACKTPYGAMKTGEALTITLLVSRRMAPRRVVLLFGHDGESYGEYPMEWKTTGGGRDEYCVSLTPDGVGLYTYAFRLETAISTVYYGAVSDGHGGEGRISEGGFTPYYVTVYEAAWNPPTWYGDGITYQIFPDRFAVAGKVPEISGRRIVKDRKQLPEKTVFRNGDVPNNYFYGGNLRGIIESLPYLKTLGVGNLYLNPIFLSESNHRYDTSDYHKIDPMLGSEAEFTELCHKAGELGMRVILDGVFNHTGDNSLYFNKFGSYPGLGAYQGKESPYYSWFQFRKFPDEYECWWNIRIMPSYDKNNQSFREFVYDVVKKWLNLGASGWRLDVADELPDDMIAGIRRAATEAKPDSLVIGEVWEDASIKIAYDVRRRYFLGNELDGVMNYPFRTAVLNYLLHGDAEGFREMSESQSENYPYPAQRSLMNFLGTHDTVRILSALGGYEDAPTDLKERAYHRLAPQARKVAEERLRLASLLLFTYLGSPTIYYGDEGGMEGLEDPFNRAFYHRENAKISLLRHYRRLAEIRRENPAFANLRPSFLEAAGTRLVMAWGDKLLLMMNAGDVDEHFFLSEKGFDLMREVEVGKGSILLKPRSAILLKRR